MSAEGRAPGASDSVDLDQFYRSFFRPLVRRAVRRHGLSFEDAGDVVQDAFVLAVGKLDPARNPKAWLYQVVDYLAKNWNRKNIRRARLVALWQPSDRPLRQQTHSSDDY
jgi:DNA-directed RNA polymerase specialized sigma24 family protein